MVAAGEDAFLCTGNNPGGTRVTFCSEEGATYILAVGSFFDENDFSFIAYDGGQCTGRPSDRCFTAHRLALGEKITGSNYESSWGTVPACADESDRGYMLTYIYTTTGQGRQVTFEALEEGTNWTLFVLVFRINACGEADSWCIAGEDDHHPFPTPIEEGKHQPAVSWFAEVSGIYFIALFGWNGDQGEVRAVLKGTEVPEDGPKLRSTSTLLAWFYLRTDSARLKEAFEFVQINPHTKNIKLDEGEVQEGRGASSCEGFPWEELNVEEEFHSETDDSEDYSSLDEEEEQKEAAGGRRMPETQPNQFLLRPNNYCPNKVNYRTFCQIRNSTQ